MNGVIEIRGSLLARNTVLNFVGQAVPLMVGVVTIPLIIRGLGTERFGILSLAWIVLGYFSLFDLGLGRATTKFVAEYLGRGETDRLARLVWTSVALQGVLGIVGGLVVATLVPLLVDKVLNIPPQFVAETKGAFYLLALSVPVVILSSSVRGVLEAGQRFDLVNAVQIPTAAARFLLPMVALLFGADLFGIVIFLVVSRLASLLAYLVLCFRVFPTLKRSFSVHLQLVRPLVSYGGWITVSNIVGPILVYLDRFLVGSLLTMAALAYYTVPYEIVTHLLIIPSSLIATLFPAFSALGASGERQRLETLFARSVKYVLLLMGPIMLAAIFFAEAILRLWLGGDFPEKSTLVFQILALGVFVNSLGYTPYSFIQGIGRPDVPAKLQLLQLPFYIAIAWLLVNRWGIAGAAAAWAIRASADGLLLFVASFRVYRLSSRLFVENALLRAILVLLALLATAYLTSSLGLDLSFQVGIIALLMMLFAWAIWRYALDSGERNLLIGLVNLPGGIWTAK
jgi:O-antigen/teichoic acid export membrane protein